MTPVAIKAGKLLAHRLYAGSHTTMDYDKVDSTILLFLYEKEKAFEIMRIYIVSLLRTLKNIALKKIKRSCNFSLARPG